MVQGRMWDAKYCLIYVQLAKSGLPWGKQFACGKPIRWHVSQHIENMFHGMICKTQTVSLHCYNQNMI